MPESAGGIVLNPQDQVDSLRIVVARQDTIIVRLAAQAGMPIPAR